jgi:hypothetical protein
MVLAYANDTFAMAVNNCVGVAEAVWRYQRLWLFAGTLPVKTLVKEV